jgi:hypothetical protein
MDPNTALKRLRDAVAEGKRQSAPPSSGAGTTPAYAQARDEVLGSLRDLAGWIEKGGFLPTEWPEPPIHEGRVYRTLEEEDMEPHGLLVHVYRSRGLNCTNGATRDHDAIIVVGDGFPPIFPAQGRPVFRLIPGVLMGTVRLVPDGCGAGEGFLPQVMFGGNYASTSDSRFSDAASRIVGHYFYGAVAVHDRTEGDT